MADEVRVVTVGDPPIVNVLLVSFVKRVPLSTPVTVKVPVLVKLVAAKDAKVIEPVPPIVLDVPFIVIAPVVPLKVPLLVRLPVIVEASAAVKEKVPPLFIVIFPKFIEPVVDVISIVPETSKLPGEKSTATFAAAFVILAPESIYI